MARPTPATGQQTLSCPPSVLSRLKRHTVRSGETLTTIARQYRLLPATLMGINPNLRQGQVLLGAAIVIPPYNGILVSVPSGKTLQDVAKAYRVRPDVLFELNGCQMTPPVAFVPGITWSPLIHNQPTAIAPFQESFQQRSQQVSPDLTGDRYPLSTVAPIVGLYGWRVNPETESLQFFSGVDLAVTPGAFVFAVADGTIAFAGDRPQIGTLVVINHAQGRQTRYVHLTDLNVKTGQRIQRGQVLGAIRPSSKTMPSHLRFEVRYRSPIGWVAQDPQPYLEAIEQ